MLIELEEAVEIALKARRAYMLAFRDRTIALFHQELIRRLKKLAFLLEAAEKKYEGEKK